VTEIMRWRLLLSGLAALIVLVLGYAWFDAGREPLRPIAEPVALPEIAG
jgi:hypothetical protein